MEHRFAMYNPSNTPVVDENMSQSIENIVKYAVKIMLPFILDAVALGCGKTYHILSEHTGSTTQINGHQQQLLQQHQQTQRPNQTHQSPVLANPEVRPNTSNNINRALLSQLHRQAAFIDQEEQEKRASNIRIKGVNYHEDEDLKQVVIDTAAPTQVRLDRADIVSCKRIHSNADNNAKTIIVRLASRHKKIELMKNKKNLPRGKYLEEDLTKVRTSIYYAVRKHHNTTSAWTKEGKIFARLNGEQVVHFTTPNDLRKIGWDDDRIANFIETGQC